jgi:hypothetical protein
MTTNDNYNDMKQRYWERELSEEDVTILVQKVKDYIEQLKMTCDRTNPQERRMRELSSLFITLGV